MSEWYDWCKANHVCYRCGKVRADAESAYIEELADVLLYAWAYGIDASKVASVVDRKIKRWDNRLGESDTDDIL